MTPSGARALAAAICVHALTSKASASAAPIVNTTTGPVVGIASDFGGYAYLGVPFAAPPQRWGPPLPAAPWSIPLNASTYGSGCVNFSPRPNAMVVDAEDCLFLNVWVPAVHASGNPLIVWIHGGGFVAGDANTDFSAYAASTGAVIVSVSYRLGALGFLNLAGMAPAFPIPYVASAAVPNAGLLDQQAGLQWAYQNAAAFGADPSHILLSGQSAGGASVLYHLTIPSSYPFYRAALAQSPGAPINSQADAQALAAAVARNLGCPASAGFAAQLACMRAAPIAAVQEAAVAAAGTYFLPITLGPSVDGALVTEAPTLAMLAGRLNSNASVVVTETLFEGDALLYLYTLNATLNASAAAAAVAQFEVMTGVNASSAEAVLPNYAGIAAADGFWNYSSRIWGDGIITCGALWAARGAALHSGGKPVHRLLYNTTIAGLPVSFQPAGRASHSTDLPILFGPPGALGPGIAAVASDLHGWITNLAVSGDVNGGPNMPPPALPNGWPMYEPFGSDSMMLVVNEQAEYTSVTGWQEEYCDAWLGALYGST